MERLPKDNQVKHLNLRNFKDCCDNSTKLMVACRSLEKLSLSSLDFNKAQFVPSIEKNGSTLKTLDLSDCWGLNFKLIQTIFAACQKLEVVDLSCTDYFKNSRISEESISFICGALPSKSTQTLNFCGLPLQDYQLKRLITRCQNISELRICKTLISEHYFDSLPLKIQKKFCCHQLSTFAKRNVANWNWPNHAFRLSGSTIFWSALIPQPLIKSARPLPPLIKCFEV